jgi:hypothetical protein
MTTDIDVAEVLQLERELQTAECRRDRARVSGLTGTPIAARRARRTSLWRRESAGVATR